MYVLVCVAAVNIVLFTLTSYGCSIPIAVQLVPVASILAYYGLLVC